MKLILVIENSHDVRVAIRTLLEGAGYGIYSATHGAEALELLDRMDRPSMILMNRELPMMSAQKFIEALRAKPKFVTIPVAFLTIPIEPKRLARTVKDCLKE